MNERIKELAEQAKKYADTEYSKLILRWGDSVPSIREIYTDKFAELIVKECADICDQQGRSGWNDDRKSQARLDRDLIKQHFGVE